MTTHQDSSSQLASRLFVILNPVAGNCDVAAVYEALEEHVARRRWAYEVHETTAADDVAQVVRDALERGYDRFVAVGGDGTVAGVAGGLIPRAAPLGIIPAGTGNVLARELNVPLDLGTAMELLVGENRIASLDAMRVGDQFFLLNVSAGITSLTIRNTGRLEKRRYGRAAYLWHGLRMLARVRPRRFVVDVDGRRTRTWASEVAVTNAGLLGDEPFRWGPHIRAHDGRVDVCIVRAPRALDYVRIAWALLHGQHFREPRLQYFAASERVLISAARQLPVQGDGEFIGHTPLELEVVPRAVQVLVPRTAGPKNGNSEER